MRGRNLKPKKSQIKNTLKINNKNRYTAKLLLCNRFFNSHEMDLEKRIEWIAIMHKQNLNGRETEDELFEAGIKAGIEETEELTKGKIYKSDLDGRITDNEFDVHHEMEGQNDFFEYFELIISDLKLPNKSKLEEALKQSILLLMQTTEFEVLESFKLKVSELKKVLEENNY